MTNWHKKAKTAVAMKNNQEALLQEIQNQPTRADERASIVQAQNKTDRHEVLMHLLSHMDESTEKSLQSLQTIVAMSTDQITKAVKIKMLLETDWTAMGKAFCGRARKTVQKYLKGTFEDKGDESCSDDADTPHASLRKTG